jgi:hypothetical protein
MAVHHVTNVEHDFAAIHMLQRLDAAVRAHNRLGTGMDVGPILDELVHLGLVVRRDLLGHGQIDRNLDGHANLCDGDIGIRSNHGTGGELHALPLDIVADAPLLGAQALLNGLEGAARALGGGGDARNLVVH